VATQVKTTLFDVIRNNKLYNPRNSATWFMNNVRNNTRAMGPLSVLGDNIHRQTDTPKIGQMFFFTYDPKTKNELPYYDTFPLVLPFSVYPDTFYGINFHYLFPKVRFALVNKLLEFSSDDKLSPNAKIQVSWKMLNNASKFPEVKPAVKQYLFSHVKSRMARIPPDDMMMSVWLPVEKFRKQSAEFVWADSKKASR